MTAVDLTAVTKDLCGRLGVKPEYVYRIEVLPYEATIHMFRGEQGFCKGPKYLVDDGGVPVKGRYRGLHDGNSQVATETITIPIRT
jgi:hypothetical protein